MYSAITSLNLRARVEYYKIERGRKWKGGKERGRERGKERGRERGKERGREGERRDGEREQSEEIFS